jgi:3'(2'), 5'-bisphosphate nucleotidase
MYDLSRELDVASSVARRAGEVLMRYYRQDVQVDRKGGNEPVTEADRASEAVILPALREAFPQYGILSEEQADHETWLQYERVWLVDPMDGTREFIGRRDGFSVMIGLLERFQPVLGVVYQPTTGTLYRGAQGGEAELLRGDERSVMRPSQIAEAAKARLVTSFSHRSERMDTIKNELGITDEQSFGSVGLKVAAIARGDRDLYLNPEGHCKVWDTCAPQAILTVAGGKMTDIRGEPLIYNDPAQIKVQRGVIASNGSCHNEVIERLAPFQRS